MDSRINAEGISDLHWNGKFPLVDNTFIWREFLLEYAAIGIVFYIVLAGLVFLMPGFDLLSSMVTLFMIVATFVLFLMLVTFLILTYQSTLWHARHAANEANALFFINEDGIGVVIDNFDLSFFGLATYLPGDVKYYGRYLGYENLKFDVFLGYPGPIIKTNKKQDGKTFRHMEWPKIRVVRIYQDRRAIYVRGDLLDVPIIVYCTPDNFAEAIGMIGERIDPKRIKKVQHG